jgi:hypothetical protein
VQVAAVEPASAVPLARHRTLTIAEAISDRETRRVERGMARPAVVIRRELPDGCRRSLKNAATGRVAAARSWAEGRQLLGTAVVAAGGAFSRRREAVILRLASPAAMDIPL